MALLFGTDDGDHIYGGRGDDFIFGGSGDDGRHSHITIDPNAPAIPGEYANVGGQTFLLGGLFGAGGDDMIFGGSGRDTLFGGLGADSLWGGRGADTFVFTQIRDSRPKAPDVIQDFGGGDSIDLSTLAGGNALEWIGKGHFSGHAWEVRANDHRLAIDSDGDGRADFRIVVDGVHHGDLIL